MTTEDTVILEDDDARIARFLQAYMGQHPYIYKDAQELINAFDTHTWEHIDVLYLDHDLGGEVYVPTSQKKVVRYMIQYRPSIGTIVLHSMNVPAAQQMKADLFEHGYRVIYCPFVSLAL